MEFIKPPHNEGTHYSISLGAAMIGVKGTHINGVRYAKCGDGYSGTQWLMEMYNIELFPLEDGPYRGGQHGR